jgi:hypothetical protein
LDVGKNNIGRPEFVQTVINEAALLANQVLEAVRSKQEVPVVVQAHPNTHILGEAYLTLMAIRYGDYVAKVGVASLSDVKTLAAYPEAGPTVRLSKCRSRRVRDFTVPRGNCSSSAASLWV